MQVSLSIMHIFISHAMSCIYLANFIVWEMSYPYISCVKCYKFPLGNISLERDQTFIYIFKTPLLGLVQRYIIRDILTFPVMFSYRTHCHAPITCYIQFLSLSVLEKYLKHLFQSVYTWLFSKHVYWLPWQIYHFFLVSIITLDLCIYRVYMHNIIFPCPSQIGLSDFLFSVHSTCTQPFSRYGVYP